MKRDFLKEIVKRKNDDVAMARQKISQQRMIELAAPLKKGRPFSRRLDSPGPGGINIIAEIKRASPSKGAIRADLDPPTLAAQYERGGAAALSVLTDGPYFHGSLEDLEKAREAISLPVLRKEFIVSSYQLYESKVHGADAVLLITRILSTEKLANFLSICDKLELDALVEVCSPEDCTSATRAGARLIGINNRDLTSFQTDINKAMRLVSLLKPEQVAVAASGISCRADIQQNLNYGIYNFLVGESLVRSENPEKMLQQMISPAS